MRNNLALQEVAGAEGICVPLTSGVITGIAADADLAAIRNVDIRPFCIRSSRVRFSPTANFSSPQGILFRVLKVYGFSAVHTGGTPKSIQAHHYHQSGIAGSTAGDRIPLTEISSVIATTAALTTATYTAPDTDEPEQVAASAGLALPNISDDYVPVAGLPWVLMPNQGLVLQNVIAMGAGGAGILSWIVDGYRLA